MGVRETGVALLEQWNKEALRKNPNLHDWESRPGEGPHGEYMARCRKCGMADLERDANKPCKGN